MNPLYKVWFWLLILAIFGFIITIIAFENQINTADTTDLWVWLVLIISILFFIASFALYVTNYTMCKNLMDPCMANCIRPGKLEPICDEICIS